MADDGNKVRYSFIATRFCLPHTIFFTVLIMFITTQISAQEICDNGIDDDGNGLIDLNDSTACSCIDPILAPDIFSLLPNPSFEDTICCPSWLSQLVCAQGWSQGTQTTPDYYNSCSESAGAAASTPYPLPAGGSFAACYFDVSWKEYLGANLLEVMEQEVSYTLHLFIGGGSTTQPLSNSFPVTFPPVDVSVFGSVVESTFYIPTNDCPESFGWSLIGTATYILAANWQQLEITCISNEPISSIMIGPPCDLPVGYSWGQGSGGTAYFFFDSLTFNRTSAFIHDVPIISVPHGCDHTLVAHPGDLTASYQWYMNGVALVGQTDSLLHISESSTSADVYQLRVSTDSACSIYQFYSSQINEVHDGYSVTVPNVFTPNGDGLNDLFLAKVNTCGPITLRVFDRWGKEVFATVDLSTGWDGSYKGAHCSEGIYYWTLEVQNPSGSVMHQGGHMTLLR